MQLQIKRNQCSDLASFSSVTSHYFPLPVRHLPAYHNVPKFSDRQVWANSADPDQTAPRGAVWSGSTLVAIPSASFGCITLRKRDLVQLLEWLQHIFGVSEYLGNLRYYTQKKYRKNPKNWDTWKICCNHPKIWTRWLYCRVLHPKDADGIANSVDPDQTALFAQTYLPICPKT